MIVRPAICRCLQAPVLVLALLTAIGCGESPAPDPGELAPDLGELAPYLHEGQDGAWRGEYADNAYWLENAAEQGAIRYYFGAYDARDDGSRRIGVDVHFDTTAPGARAGLLYGYQEGSGNYYLITLGAGGEFTAYRRDERGVREVMSSATEVSAGPQRIEIQERGRAIEMFIDDRSMGTLQSPGTGSGAAGIAALGVGRFGFNRYRSSGASRGDSAMTSRADGNGSPERPVPAQETTREATRSPASGAMTERTINDEFGFERPVSAYRLSLPENWSLKGSVQWYGVAECPLELNKLHFMATAPDGTVRIEFIPGGSWGWMSLYDVRPEMRQYQSLNCATKRILDMRSFMQEYVPGIRPNARIVSSRARPDLVQKTLATAGGLPGSPNQQVKLEVQEVELSYEADGKTINELLVSTVLFSRQPGADPYGGMTGYIVAAQAMGTIAIANVNAPPDRELLEEVGDSIVMLPDYQKRVEAVMQQRSQMMAQALQRRRAAQQQYLASRRAAAASRSASSAGTAGSDILDIQYQGWKSRDAMTSAGQARSVDGIHDRTAFDNTQGQIVYMPTTHSRVYQLPNDVYVGTNDPFFNPVQATGQFGTELSEHNYGW